MVSNKRHSISTITTTTLTTPFYHQQNPTWNHRPLNKGLPWTLQNNPWGTTTRKNSSMVMDGDDNDDDGGDCDDDTTM